MTKTQMLARALNIALAELRDISTGEHVNCFDSVMKHFPAEVRRYIKIDTSPVYWDNNDYDPDYVARLEQAKA
jgi:hypothetical protein